jgi:hypothetical protein
MQWTVYMPSRVNRANPYTISGFIDGECRMESASSSGEFTHCEKAVIARLGQIAKAEGRSL